MRIGIAGTTFEGVFSRRTRGDCETMNDAISYAAVSERNTSFSGLRQFATKRSFIAPVAGGVGVVTCVVA